VKTEKTINPQEILSRLQELKLIEINKLPGLTANGRLYQHGVSNGFQDCIDWLNDIFLED
jgi:hypothetical protein